jgi:hypothetical protein
MPAPSPDELIEPLPEEAMTEEPGSSPPAEAWTSERSEYQAFRRFVKLTKECRLLEYRVKEMKKEIEDLGYQLRDYLGSTGYQNVAVDGYTVFLRRDLFVRARDGMNQGVVCSVLKRNGLGHFVKEQYSVSALSGHVRELEQEHEEEFRTGERTSVAELLPLEVAAVLNCDPKFSVVALKSGKG